MGGSNIDRNSTGQLADSSPVLEESSVVDDLAEGSDASDSQCDPPGPDVPDHLIVSREVVDATLAAPSNLSMAAGWKHGEQQLLIRQQDLEGKESELWPCVVIRLAGSEAIDCVEEGLAVAVENRQCDLDDQRSNRAVVICLADGEDGCEIRGFAGSIDDLEECSVSIESVNDETAG